jgi:hypothetical protein
VPAPQCPFAARGGGPGAMTTCPGFMPEPIILLFAGDSCGHRGVQQERRTSRYLSACRHPGGLPDGVDGGGLLTRPVEVEPTLAAR